MDRSCSQDALFNTTPGVKIALLWKRSQCLRAITKPNYRHRVFILTENSLSYYSGTIDRIGGLKGRIPLVNVRAVEFVEEAALGLPHTLQVIYTNKKHGFVTLYITARDRSECGDWVGALRDACYFNEDMLMHYHPGVFIKGRWSCCQSRDKVTLGCQPTFHLLTRSSSRYADMRRRDTLLTRSTRRRKNSTYSLSMLGSPNVGGYGCAVRSSSCSQLATVACDIPVTVQELLLGTSEVSPPPHSVASFSLNTVAVCEAATPLTLPWGETARMCETTVPSPPITPTSVATLTAEDECTNHLAQPSDDREDDDTSREPDELLSADPAPTIQPRISDCNPDVIHV